MPRLSLSLFGSLHITLDDASLTAFESDKARALLAFLAVEAQHPHRRDSLVGLLWPDIRESSARQSLRQTLFTLRQTIHDPTATPPYLLITRDSLQFNRESDHSLDVATFITLLAACDQHTHASLETCDECTFRLQHATELYRGAFLQDFFLPDCEAFEAWAVIQREALQQRALDALTQLATYHAQRDDHEATLRYARRQLALDPWREQAHRQVMRALALSGHRNEALAQFETCRRVLADELGVEPMTETLALYEQIKRGDSPTPRLADKVNPIAHPSPSPPHSHTQPPPHSLTPAPLHNLPTMLTPFIGRARELAALAPLLANPDARLITLVGPGGAGKTRLAIQAASETRTRFAHGVVFVSLASVTQSELIVSAIADALGLKFQGLSEPRAQLWQHLQTQQLLLLLDNFEHLLTEPGIGVAMELLQHAPHVKLLVTSREPLQVQSEWVCEVAGLADDAQTLFLQSARRAQVGFAPSTTDIAAIKQICALVGGLPLGIELAATWVRTLACAEIAQELERGLDILTTTAHDLPTRHRSMQVVFDYSWQLLSIAERGVLTQLSVFRGGFTREAAQAVAAATLPLLSALVAKSLVRRSEAGRYDLHELVRQFAAMHLASKVDASYSHALYYLTLIERAGSQLNGPQQSVWMKQLRQEYDNIRLALEWSLNVADHRRSDLIERVLRAVVAIPRFWHSHALGEGRHWLRRGLAAEATLERRSPPVVRAKALNVASWLARTTGDFADAELLLQEGLHLYRAANDTDGIAAVLDTLGDAAWSQGSYAQAVAFYEESLTLRRTLGEKHKIAWSLSSLGNAVVEQGDYLRAFSLYEESLNLCRALGDERGSALALYGLGVVAFGQGEYPHARARLQESLRVFHQLGNQVDIALCFEWLAILKALQQQMRLAVQLWSASDFLLETLSVALTANYRIRHDLYLTQTRAQLDPTTFAAAWAEGRALSLEQAMTLALESL